MSQTVPLDKSTSKNLVLTDWAANAEGIAHDPGNLLWELVLHSFLHEQVLMQDEALAQSERLAGWFHKDSFFEILEELIETGAFSVVVQPPETYPTDELRNWAPFAPVQAKCKYISDDLLKHGKPFHVTAEQRRFQARLDEVLTRKKATRLREADVHERFASRLLAALKTDEREYDRRFQHCFGLDLRLRKELASFVEQPEKIYDRLKKDRGEPRLDPRYKDQPMFSRNLGHLLASTYSERGPGIENTINGLIHSAYAAAFGKSHGDAATRYNEWLQPLPPLPEDLKTGIRLERYPTRPAYQLATSLKLPTLDLGLCKIIQEVRDSDACRNLRSSLKMAGQQPSFDDQRQAWNEFAGVLASKVSTGIQTPVYALMQHSLKGAMHDMAGVVIVNLGLLAKAFSGEPLDPAELVLTGRELGAVAVHISLEVSHALLWNWTERDRLQAEFERALTLVAEI